MFFHVILRKQIYKLYLKKQKIKTVFYSEIKYFCSYYFYKIRIFLLLNEIYKFYLFFNTLTRPFVTSHLPLALVTCHLSLVTIKVSSSLSSGSPRILSRIWATVRVSRSQ